MLGFLKLLLSRKLVCVCLCVCVCVCVCMCACACVWCVCVPSECYLHVVGDGQRLLAAKVLFASLEFFVC